MSVPELKTADELAQTLGRNRKWIYRAVEELGLPAYKVGRSLLFDATAVTAWLDDQRVGAWPTNNHRSRTSSPPEIGEAPRQDAPSPSTADTKA